MTTECFNCRRYVALVQTEQSNVFQAVNMAADGFTPTTTPHACGESDRRHA